MKVQGGEEDIKLIEGMTTYRLIPMLWAYEALTGRLLDGMLLPPLCTQADYVRMAENAGLKALQPPKDISKDVAKTWYVQLLLTMVFGANLCLRDISWQLVSSPSLWAFAISQGRDGLAFLQAFRAMRRGYASGAFRYAVVAFERS
jgi:tocopherol O-methyltransferase